MVCGFGEEVAYDTLVSRARQGPARQELPLHRLGKAPPDPGPDHLRPGRRHPPAHGLPGPRRAEIERRGRTAWVEEELRRPHRPRPLRAPGRGGLEAAQDPHPRPPVPGHRPGARHLARAGGAAPRPAARPHHPRRPPDGGRGHPPALGRGAALAGAGQCRPRECRRHRRHRGQGTGHPQGPAAPPARAGPAPARHRPHRRPPARAPEAALRKPRTWPSA